MKILLYKQWLGEENEILRNEGRARAQYWNQMADIYRSTRGLANYHVEHKVVYQHGNPFLRGGIHYRTRNDSGAVVDTVEMFPFDMLLFPQEVSAWKSAPSLIFTGMFREHSDQAVCFYANVCPRVSVIVEPMTVPCCVCYQTGRTGATPYFQCGHSKRVCSNCFHRLAKPICPLCRSS